MIDIINILAIINLVLLALFMAVQKVNKRTNLLFALVNFIPATDFLINYLIYTGGIFKVPYLVFINLSFLWGPVLLWYVMVMIGTRIRLTFKTALHVAPQLISWGFWSYSFLQGGQYVDAIFARRAAQDYPLPVALLQGIVICQVLGYTIYCTYLVYKFRPEPENAVMQAKMNWLKLFMRLLVVLGILVLASAIIFGSAVSDNLITPVLYMVFYCMVVYKSFQSFGVFPDSAHMIHVREEVIREEQVSRDKYVNSTLRPEQLAAYKNTLLIYLTEKEPFIKPDLTLAELAASLELSQHQLSQIVNQAFDKNFADLVNSYRVEKSKNLLNDPALSGLTLEAIGLQSGFGSSSAFYRAFKKYTGTTPKAFLNGRD